MTEHVKIAVTDHVLHITLARPEKKNALTQAMYVAIGEALTRSHGPPSSGRRSVTVMAAVYGA